MPDDLFWRLTPLELDALLSRVNDRRVAEQRAADYRAGLIAASVFNASGRFGAWKQPRDFFREPPNPPTLEELKELEHCMAPSKSIRA